MRGEAFDTESSGKREGGREGEGSKAAVENDDEEDEEGEGEGEGDECKHGLSEPDNDLRFRSSCWSHSHELKEAGRGREGCWISCS
jgi:hypothetical protein